MSQVQGKIQRGDGGKNLRQMIGIFAQVLQTDSDSTGARPSLSAF